MKQFFTRIHTWVQEHRHLAAVRRQLQSPRREVQAEAIYLLVILRDTWGLRCALHHADPWVRREAIKGLAQLRGAEAVRWLGPALADADRNVAHTAAECLGRMETKDLQLLWALRQCVASEDWLVRYYGAVGLARLCGKSPEVDRLLADLAQDEHSWVRNTATQALQRKLTRRDSSASSLRMTNAEGAEEQS